MLEHILLLLKHHGITDILLTVHYLADEIISYFGDGADWDLNLTYLQEDEPLGTAGAVRQAADWLGDEPFLVISGDSLTDCDLMEVVDFHNKRKALATIVLSKVARPLEFGVVITDSNDRVVRFVEKPGWSEVFSDTVNTGIYVLDPKILSIMEPKQVYDWSGDVFPILLDRGDDLLGFVTRSYWCDVGSLAQYREAQEQFLAGQINLPFSGYSGGVWVEPNSQIDPHAILVPPVCIGRNVKVRRGARVGPYTVIGDNSIVEEEALVERSTTWDSAYIGPGTRLHSATLCSRVTLKKDTVVQEDAVIGDRCLLDVGCVIRPRVKLWPDKSIDRGSTLNMSLIWGNRWRGTLFRDLGVAGLSNIECTPDFACRLGSAFGSILPHGSKVALSRDSTRSSRMIKRALVSSLLSVGCDVIDLHSLAVPVARHFVHTNECGGAIHVRKYPGNVRVTLMETLDGRGAYLPRSTERKVESAFFREDFKRTDPDDLGVIESPSYAVDNYQTDFLKRIAILPRKLRVACDFGYGPLSSFYPAMLTRLGLEVVSLNAFNDARLAPRTPDQVERHLQTLCEAVGSLRLDLGVLFLDEGERMIIVDDSGKPLDGNALLAAFCTLIAELEAAPSIALSIAAPGKLEAFLNRRGVSVIRTKSDTRSLLTTAVDAGVRFSGDSRGGFIFPEFSPAFDAAFAFGKLVSMVSTTGHTLSKVAAELPVFHMAYDTVKCVWEAKGSIMRALAEQVENDRLELVDGIKIHREGGWILVLPDAIEPLFHVYAEADSDEEAKALLDEFTVLIGRMSQEIARNLPG